MKELKIDTIKSGITPNSLRVVYDAYKEYLLTIGIIIVCLLLFAKFIIPQIQELFLINGQKKEIEQKIRILKNNMYLLSSLSDSDLDSKLEIATGALPPEKDFAGVLNAIQISSAKSGVLLGDFEFKVGELSTKSAGLTKQPGMEVTLTVRGGIDSIKRFIVELSKSSPISQVSSVNITGTSAVVTTVFNYKPFSPVAFNAKSPLFPLTRKDLNLLESLSLK